MKTITLQSCKNDVGAYTAHRNMCDAINVPEKGRNDEFITLTMENGRKFNIALRPLDVQIPDTPWIFDCSEHKGWFKRADGFCKIEGGKLQIYIGDDLPLTVNTSKIVPDTIFMPTPTPTPAPVVQPKPAPAIQPPKPVEPELNDNQQFVQKVLSLVAQGMRLENAFFQVRREVGLYDREKSDRLLQVCRDSITGLPRR